jgi:hypothetical protein
MPTAPAPSWRRITLWLQPQPRGHAMLCACHVARCRHSVLNLLNRSPTICCHTDSRSTRPEMASSENHGILFQVLSFELRNERGKFLILDACTKELAGRFKRWDEPRSRFAIFALSVVKKFCEFVSIREIRVSFGSGYARFGRRLQNSTIAAKMRKRRKYTGQFLPFCALCVLSRLVLQLALGFRVSALHCAFVRGVSPAGFI